jgi:hypothetical protein
MPQPINIRRVGQPQTANQSARTVSQMMTPEQREQIARSQREVENAEPLKRTGWWDGLPRHLQKFLAGGLGFSNGYLFAATIGGWYGAVIAATAVSMEMLAAWALLNADRTTEEHRQVLLKWSKRLGAFSLVHCVVAILHVSAYLSNIPWLLTALAVYSHVFAFPAIIVLVWMALNEIIGEHWGTKVYQVLIKGKIRGQAHLSETQVNQQIMLVNGLAEEMRTEFFKLRTEMQQALIPALIERGETEEQMEAVLQKLSPQIERKIRAELDAITKPAQLTSGNPPHP